jgi:hypothetical protein
MDCPWRAFAQLTDGLWKIIVSSDAHNHEMVEEMSAFHEARVLNNDQKKMVCELTLSGATSKVILATLQQQDKSIQVITKDIHNLRQAMRLENLQGNRPIEFLLDSLLQQNQQPRLLRDSSGHLTHLFFCPSDAFSLFQTFHGIILADCTYKTNRFKMLLLHFVGVTPCNNSFSFGFAFLAGETEADYCWVVNGLKATLKERGEPWLFVTDRDLALMNAIAEIFPLASNIICTWHIEKNVTTNCNP